MKHIIISLLIKSLAGFSQKVSTVDIVKINSKYEKEAMYFYEQNWLEFRKEAIKQKVIIGYEMFRSATDSTNHYDLTLITSYKDEKAFKVSEDKFRPIMSKISPNGPKYLNEVKRQEFLQYVAGSEGKLLYYSKKNQ
jgi:hypothetical protein